MQYEIEDILREKDYKTYYLLSSLLDACADELELLVTEQLEEKDLIQRLRRRIKELFGPHETVPEEIRLDQFVEEKLQALRPRFAHRKCHVETRISGQHLIWIPADVLGKILVGLVRNAVENTPDGGQIRVSVKKGQHGPELEVKDTGIGISEENQRLIFENYFTAYETMQYSSRNPYDFGAGGKGFDLLRMRIFSERYDFKLKMKSRRCSLMADDSEACDGYIKNCVHSGKLEDCLDSGGTTVTVQFKPVNESTKSATKSEGRD